MEAVDQRPADELLLLGLGLEVELGPVDGGPAHVVLIEARALDAGGGEEGLELLYRFLASHGYHPRYNAHAWSMM